MIDQYSKLIFTVCFSFTGDRLDSEDLTQETFLSAYKKISTVRYDNIKAWLCSIAANKCRDYLRKHKKDREFLQTSENGLGQESSNMEETAEFKEAAELLKNVISELKEPYRTVACCYYINNIPTAEIAKARNIPLKTLQTQLRRAKDMIRAGYKEAYKDDA